MSAESAGAGRSDAETRVGDLRRLVAEFVAERDWEQFHDPKNLAMSIAIEAAELMEHFQWLRSDQLEAAAADAATRAAIEEELADVACYLLALSNRLGVDLSNAIERKMARNREKYPADRFRGRFR